VGKEDRHDNVLRKIWEGVSDAVAELFENQRKETVATKIPLRGEIGDPKANILFAIIEVLQNAFVSALQPSIDRQINLRTVDREQEKKGFLDKVFGKGEKRKGKKQKRKDEEKRG
jgi:hypothetical protein